MGCMLPEGGRGRVFPARIDPECRETTMFRRFLVCTLLGCIIPLSAMAAAATQGPYDLIIRNGHIIDGTGSPWYSGDVAIRDGRIAAIGRLKDARAKQVIDAHGDVVAPGFIDMLGQSDMSILAAPTQPSKIFQGITTEFTGEGSSPAPQNDHLVRVRKSACERYQLAQYHLTCDWRTYPEYFSRLEKRGLGINMGFYVGATTVRKIVLGYDDVTPTPAQLKQMQDLVGNAMRAGAFGLSSALQYPPAPFAKTSELIALAKVASKYGGIYTTHMRSEGNAEMEALEETFRISREADIPVEIWHLKVAGKKNWGNAAKVIARIDKARAAGLDVAADTYAYTAWSNGLASFTPPWANAGGTAKMIERLKDPKTRARIRKDMQTPTKAWNNTWEEIQRDAHAILIVSVRNPELDQYVGMRMDEVAKQWREDPLDTLLDFLIKDRGRTSIAVFGMSQPDVSLILKQPWVSVDNDSRGTSPTGLMRKLTPHPHPRAYGTFPRILRKYVREDHLLTLPDAIRKFTALPAQRMGLTQRGVLKKGMYADIVVFDPTKIRDLATYAKPNQLSVGMRYVLVNGVPVISAGKMTHALPGKVLYGPGYTGGK